LGAEPASMGVAVMSAVVPPNGLSPPAERTADWCSWGGG
jgi:hypothetical protein